MADLIEGLMRQAMGSPSVGADPMGAMISRMFVAPGTDPDIAGLLQAVERMQRLSSTGAPDPVEDDRRRLADERQGLVRAQTAEVWERIGRLNERANLENEGIRFDQSQARALGPSEIEEQLADAKKATAAAKRAAKLAANVGDEVALAKANAAIAQAKARAAEATEQARKRKAIAEAERAEAWQDRAARETGGGDDADEDRDMRDLIKYYNELVGDSRADLSAFRRDPQTGTLVPRDPDNPRDLLSPEEFARTKADHFARAMAELRRRRAAGIPTTAQEALNEVLFGASASGAPAPPGAPADPAGLRGLGPPSGADAYRAIRDRVNAHTGWGF